MKLGVVFGWHGLAWEELRALVQRAEALGYAAAYVDGDVSQIPSLGEAEILDGWTVTTALLAATERIQVGSIRLVGHWNTARLAQAVATAERLTPGRLRFLISIGGQRLDRRFGLPVPPAAERIRHLDEMLDALRALWRGEEVTRHGRYVTLDRARIRPAPGSIAIEVGARRAKLLRVVARHADRWDLNLPPLRGPVEEATRLLETACREQGRDPARIERSMWIFARPDRDPADPSLRAEYRRFNPWFAELPDAAVREALAAGDAAACRRRIERARDELHLDLPVVDLSGLTHDAAQHALEGLILR